MPDIDMALQSLLGLAQLAIGIVVIDALLGFYLDMSFLSGGLKQFAYLGGAVGVIDHYLWYFTERIPNLVEM